MDIYTRCPKRLQGIGSQEVLGGLELPETDLTGHISHRSLKVTTLARQHVQLPRFFQLVTVGLPCDSTEHMGMGHNGHPTIQNRGREAISTGHGM